jgi:hypothetical protein
LINIPGFEDGEIIRKLAKIGVLYLPQLIERCKGDIKQFMDKEVNHRLPVEDLKEIFKALEKVPIELQKQIHKKKFLLMSCWKKAKMLWSLST